MSTSQNFEFALLFDVRFFIYATECAAPDYHVGPLLFDGVGPHATSVTDFCGQFPQSPRFFQNPGEYLYGCGDISF